MRIADLLKERHDFTDLRKRISEIKENNVSVQLGSYANSGPNSDYLVVLAGESFRGEKSVFLRLIDWHLSWITELLKELGVDVNDDTSE